MRARNKKNHKGPLPPQKKDLRKVENLIKKLDKNESLKLKDIIHTIKKSGYGNDLEMHRVGKKITKLKNKTQDLLPLFFYIYFEHCLMYRRNIPDFDI